MINQKKKLCAYAAIAATLTLSPLVAVGQTAPATSPASAAAATRQASTTDDPAYRDEHHNYGWIGLLGLVGLTGLLRKRDTQKSVDYTERTTDNRRSTSGTRS